MFEKPNLPDETIVDQLLKVYGVRAVTVTFLPIGYDARSWIYAVDGGDGQRYFLKVRRGPIYAASLAIPRHLHGQGIGQVVAPLATRLAKLWAETDDFWLILYPFVDGLIAAEVGLSDNQWRDFGALLAAIHEAALPATLLGQVQTESFIPPWSKMVRTLQSMIDRGDQEDPVARDLVGYWKTRQAEIGYIVERTEELGRQFESQANELVLCHADIHTHNLMVDDWGGLHVVDWDGIVLAPRERDLMFVVDGAGEDRTRSPSEQHFFAGYGETKIDPVALAYYRYEWVVQEIGDCGERVLLTSENGERTRRAAVQDFIELFEPGDVVDGAYQSDPDR